MFKTRKIHSIVVVAFFAVAAGFLKSEALYAQQDLNYETIRFYTKNSKPERMLSYAFSPDGRYMAVSFDRGNLGARPGVTIVDLQKKELLRTVGGFSFFTLAFSSDSRRLLGVGGYAGVQLVDVGTGSIRKYNNLRDTPGKIGMDIAEKNGKLLVTRISEDFNSTIEGQIQVGDEILAINEGETPTKFIEYRGWTTLAGKTKSKALQAMSGKPGTWVQLRLARRGSSTPVVACVQRQWPNSTSPKFPESGVSLTQAISRNVFQFRSADTLEVAGYARLRDIKSVGQHIVSPDATKFAALAKTVSGNGFGVEVHSLETGKLVHSTDLDTTNFRHIRFSLDSRLVLVGTRDTVEIFDTEKNEWLSPVVLTPPDESDNGRVVTRRIPLGLGLPGDLYTTSREVVYSKPAALAQFAVAPNGTLAIASETGEVVLASLKNKQRTGLVGDNLLGARPEMIEFSPSGDRLVAFAKGVLHIVDVEGQPKQEVVQADR